MAELTRFRTRMSRPENDPTIVPPKVGDVSPKGSPSGEAPWSKPLQRLGENVRNNAAAVGSFLAADRTETTRQGIQGFRQALSTPTAEAATPPAPIEPVASHSPVGSLRAPASQIADPVANADYWNAEIAAGRVGGNAGFRDQRVINYDDGTGRSGSYLNPANPENIADAQRRGVEVMRGGTAETTSFRPAQAAAAGGPQPDENGVYWHNVGPAYDGFQRIAPGTEKAYYEGNGVFRNARTGASFGSMAEAESGNPIEVAYKNAGIRALAAKAGLDEVTAELLPQVEQSKAGFRQDQGAYYQGLGEAAMRPKVAETKIDSRVVELPSSDPKEAAMGVKRPVLLQTDASGNFRTQPITDMFSEAQAAIAAGAERSAVVARLRQMGADESILAKYFPEE